MPTLDYFAQFTMADHQRALADAEAKFLRLSELAEDVARKIIKGPGPHGIKLPWLSTHDNFRLGDGQLTVLAGENGSGKSTLASQILVDVAANHDVLMMSLEMDASDVTSMMAKQWSGKDEIALGDYKSFVLDCDDHVWTLENPTEITPQRVLGALWQAADIGVKFVVLDNLQCVNLSTKYDDEKIFIVDIASVAKVTGIHILMVHHTRKSQADQGNIRPTRDRVLGSGAITNIAQNVILVWANEERQTLARKREAGIHLLSEENAYLAEHGDIEFKIEKQRFGPDRWNVQLFLDAGRLHKDGEMAPNCLPARRRVPGVAG